jgi:hypothetical protein
MKRTRKPSAYAAMKLMRRFIAGAKISAVLLIPTCGAVFLIYGTHPIFSVTPYTRRLIMLVWLWNVLVFTWCGGMVLGAWLIDRFGDRPGED